MRTERIALSTTHVPTQSINGKVFLMAVYTERCSLIGRVVSTGSRLFCKVYQLTLIGILLLLVSVDPLPFTGETDCNIHTYILGMTINNVPNMYSYFFF